MTNRLIESYSDVWDGVSDRGYTRDYLECTVSLSDAKIQFADTFDRPTLITILFSQIKRSGRKIGFGWRVGKSKREVGGV